MVEATENNIDNSSSLIDNVTLPVRTLFWSSQIVAEHYVFDPIFDYVRDTTPSGFDQKTGDLVYSFNPNTDNTTSIGIFGSQGLFSNSLGFGGAVGFSLAISRYQNEATGITDYALNFDVSGSLGASISSSWGYEFSNHIGNTSDLRGSFVGYEFGFLAGLRQEGAPPDGVVTGRGYGMVRRLGVLAEAELTTSYGFVFGSEYETFGDLTVPVGFGENSYNSIGTSDFLNQYDSQSSSSFSSSSLFSDPSISGLTASAGWGDRNDYGSSYNPWGNLDYSNPSSFSYDAYTPNYISDPSAPYSSLFGSGSSYGYGTSFTNDSWSSSNTSSFGSSYDWGYDSSYSYSGTSFDTPSYSYDYGSSYSSSSYDYGSSSSSYISDSSWSSSYSDTFTYSGYTGGSSSYGGSSSGSWGSWGWPVVLDLDGDGVELVTLDQSPAFFDFDEDSYQENSVCNTAWVSSTGAEISAANDNQASLQEAA